jgi:sugar O-acyltransferase (sialic acid O-acetyltransferase NeuD family)
MGREVLDWALAVPSDRRDWEVAGFLDSRPGALDGFTTAVGIVGDPETFPLGEHDRVVCALGVSKIRLEYCRRLKARGARFGQVIHPSAVIGSATTLGEGCILCPGAIVTNHVRVGNYVSFDLHATASHDCVIGDACTLSPHAGITGRVTLGTAAFLGAQAMVLPGVTIGDGAIVGAGAVVIADVAAGTTVAGVPARVLRRA